MNKRLAAVAALSFLASCGGKGASVLVLELSAEGDYAANRLSFQLGAIERTFQGAFPKADRTALKIGLSDLPAALGGSVSLTVRALDAGDCVVANASETVSLRAGEVSRASIIVRKLAMPECPGQQAADGGADAAVGADATADAPVADGSRDSVLDAPIETAIAPDMAVVPSDAGPDGGAPKRQNGEACGAAGDCLSQYCADGVCCNGPCAGQCQSCNGAGTRGTCLSVTGDPQGGRPACAGGAGACGGTCNGTVGAACTYPGFEKFCGPATCSNSVAQPAPACDGKGACLMPATVSCAPYACVGTTCAGGCSDVNPCTSANYCESGRCVPKLAQGGACRGDSQCVGGHCADGVCCDSACTGDCEACNVAGKAGTCSFQQGMVCRESRGDCDPAESCSASAGTCPADQLHGATFTCRQAVNVCDQPETCTGAAVGCPTDLFKGAGNSCRGAANPCDPVESCTGASPLCPADVFMMCDAAVAPPPDAAAPPADTAPAPADTTTGCTPPVDVTDVSWNPNSYPAFFGITPQVTSLVWNGSGYTNAWYSNSGTSGGWRIFANRLDANGVEVAGSRSIVSTQSTDSYLPSIAYSGATHAIVYVRGVLPQQVWMRRLDSAAAITGTETQVSTAVAPADRDQVNAKVVWNYTNSEWGVVWDSFDNNNDSFVNFRRVSNTGAALGSAIRPAVGTAATGSAGGAQLLWNGSSYVVAWTQHPNLVLGFIAGDGVTVTKRAVGAASVSGGGPPRDPTVAFSGSEYGLGWGDFPGGPTTWMFYFGRANSAGDTIPGSVIPISTPGAVPNRMGVAWTGTEWLVVWNEYPSISASVARIWRARISAAGTLVAGSRMEITCTSGVDSALNLVWGGNKAGVAFLRGGGDGRLLMFP